MSRFQLPLQLRRFHNLTIHNRAQQVTLPILSSLSSWRTAIFLFNHYWSPLNRIFSFHHEKRGSLAIGISKTEDW